MKSHSFFVLSHLQFRASFIEKVYCIDYTTSYVTMVMSCAAGIQVVFSVNEGNATLMALTIKLGLIFESLKAKEKAAIVKFLNDWPWSFLRIDQT